LENIKSAASTTGGNFDEFKIGRAAWEACSRNLEFGNHLSICLKTEKNLNFEDETRLNNI
jgi:hypothetical protein